MTSEISNAAEHRLHPRRRIRRGDGAQHRQLVRIGLRRDCFGDADLCAQHRAEFPRRPDRRAMQSTMRTQTCPLASYRTTIRSITTPGTYTFNPVTTVDADEPDQQPSGPVPEWLCRRRDVDGDQRVLHEAVYRHQSHRTAPGDVGIYLPGAFERAARLLQCRQRQCADERDDLLLLSVRRSGRRQRISLRAEHGAGHLCEPVQFRRAGRAIFNNGANTPISTRVGDNFSGTVGYANQLMVTADSVGANTAVLPHIDLLGPCYALRVRIDQVGSLGRLQRRKGQQRQPRIRGSGQSAALGRGRSHNPRKPSDDRHGHLHGPRDRQYRQRDRGPHLPCRRDVFRRGQLRSPQWRRSRSTASTERTTLARPTGSPRPSRSMAR